MLDITKRFYESLRNPKIFNVKGQTGFYPSSASIVIDGEKHGSCHRAEYYRWFRYKPTEDTDPEGALAGLMGDALHTMVASVLRNSTIETDITVLSNEQSFWDSERFLSGRTDLFMQDNRTKELHGCDVKTVGEYKAGTVIEQPDIVHMIQCAIYLDQYNKSAAINNSRPVKDWIILYLSRAETYKLKKYAHGSLFKYMWQFSLDLDKGHVSITNQYGSVKEYKEITMEKIYERYDILKEQIQNVKFPDRDYEYQYSEEKLVGMLKMGKLLKGQSEEVQKWLDKGAKPGQLKLELGDFACRYCSWKSQCWSSDPLPNTPKEKKVLYNIPKDMVVVKPVTVDVNIL